MVHVWYKLLTDVRNRGVTTAPADPAMGPWTQGAQAAGAVLAEKSEKS